MGFDKPGGLLKYWQLRQTGGGGEADDNEEDEEDDEDDEVDGNEDEGEEVDDEGEDDDDEDEDETLLEPLVSSFTLASLYCLKSASAKRNGFPTVASAAKRG